MRNLLLSRRAGHGSSWSSDGVPYRSWERCNDTPRIDPGARAAPCRPVLAELMGRSVPSVRAGEGSFMAASGDERGTMIAVYPARATVELPPVNPRQRESRAVAGPLVWGPAVAASTG